VAREAGKTVRGAGLRARGPPGVAFVVCGVACVVREAVRGLTLLMSGHERQLPYFFF